MGTVDHVLVKVRRMVRIIFLFSPYIMITQFTSIGAIIGIVISDGQLKVTRRPIFKTLKSNGPEHRMQIKTETQKEQLNN